MLQLKYVYTYSPYYYCTTTLYYYYYYYYYHYYYYYYYYYYCTTTRTSANFCTYVPTSLLVIPGMLVAQLTGLLSHLTMLGNQEPASLFNLEKEVIMLGLYNQHAEPMYVHTIRTYSCCFNRLAAGWFCLEIEG